ncbi:BRCT domain-containing protein [Paralcaligenes ginsengisoli]
MGWFSDNFTKSDSMRDANGQPRVLAFRSEAVAERQIDELIGLVKGVLADGAICQEEVEFLYGWMTTNKGAADVWPANVLYPRISDALSDGHMDADEEKEIMELLLAAVGGNTAPLHGQHSNSSTLPLCKPVPVIEFEHHSFCFTGKFNSGTRTWCEEQVQLRGGISASGITKKLNYLVIGEIGSRDWLHSTYGLKINKAIEYRNSGTPLHIVSEQSWYERLAG